MRIAKMGLAVLAITALSLQLTLPSGAKETRKVAESSTTIAAVAECGKKAPDFTLPNTQGKNESLSDYAGKFVVLEWVNFGCPFVKKHYESSNMQKLQDAYTKKGVIWLSICSSADGRQGNMPASDINKAIKEKNAHPTSYLIDKDGKVGKMYGAKATPHMYVIDTKGTLVYKGAIDDKASVDQEDISGAKNYVKAALDEAMAGRKVSTASTKAYGCSVKYQQ
ncbi:MAG: thioredoxin family protein [Candidatus Obscuribacterales bacterium]|nr:thioredoxin family protein [Candidatus Obscuribacterales bacterium]